MKSRLKHHASRHLLLLCFIILHSTFFIRAWGQGTAFTYQGQLVSSNAPANGSFDLTFSLYDNSISGSLLAGPVTNTATAVSNGLFMVTVDFGANFPGANRWLEIGVRTNGSVTAYSTLTPRQKITATPYAITAGNLTGTLPAGQLSGALPSTQLAGTYSGAVTLNSPANSFTGNGTGLTNVNAATLGGLNSSSFWKTSGNAGTTPGVNFLGTTDNQPLELWANNSRGLRLEPNNSGAPNLIGGASVNYVTPGIVGAVIGGGGATNAGSFGSNSVSGNFGFIGGGNKNFIQPGDYSTIGGGENNSVLISSDHSTIGGGSFNQINPNSVVSTIVGGTQNGIANLSGYSTIGGGNHNYIYSGAPNSTIGGGSENRGGASGGGTGSYGTVPGGYQNQAVGNYSFAAGQYAQALHNGTFVWEDSLNTTPFASTKTNQFLIRATGGVGINTNNPGTNALQIIGIVAATKFVGDGSGLTGISGAAIADGSITSAQLANNSVTAAQLASGTAVKSLNGLTDAVTLAPGANVTFSTNLNTLTITAAGGGGGSGWALTGNGGTAPGANFLGTTDNQALELKVNNTRALRLEPNTNGAPNVIGGSSVNFATPDVAGVTIAGGGSTNYSGHYYTNSVASYFGTIGGGNQNTIQSNSISSTIGGGAGATVLANAVYGTIGGGSGNKVTGSFGTVPGGSSNTATNYSFAAGLQAKANHSGTFVWSDNSTITAFASTGTNQFLIRAVGGVGIGTNNPGTNALAVAGSVAATTFIGDGSQLTGISGGGGGSVTTVNTGPGLSGGPITTSGTISIPASGVVNSMLANPAVTVSAGTGLSGGGSVALGGTTTLNNAGVLSVTAASPLVSSGGQNPQISLTGNIPDAQLSANVTRLDGTNVFTGTNRFAGAVILTNTANVLVGNGTGLTALTPANLSAGTAGINISGNAATATTATTANNFSGALAGDVTGTQGATVVTPNIPRLNGTNIFTGTNTFAGLVNLTNVNNTFTGNGAGLTGLTGAAIASGSIADARLSANVPLLNGTNVFSGTNTFNGLVKTVGGLVIQNVANDPPNPVPGQIWLIIP